MEDAFCPLTSDSEINTIVSHLLSQLHLTLGIVLVGLYLHGSLAYGGFDPETSDIDFLVVTAGRLPDETVAALKEMHAGLGAGGSKWFQKQEGAYLPKDDLRRHDPAHAPVPWLGSDGHFALETLGPDWILQRWILREKGLVIAGPPLRATIDPVSSDDLREAVRASLEEWWSPPFPSPERIQSGGYRAYAVLTMCRSLFLLEHGRPASKPEAARWAMKTLGKPWADLIAAAVRWRPGMGFDRLDETVGLIRFTLKYWGLPAGDQTQG